MSKSTLMAVFAHPDDEAFGTGGTLTKYGAEGHDVYLITATRGEAGQIAEPDLATPANLPLVRERELRCACQVYGIHPPRFLDYVDGTLPQVHQGQAVAKLVRLIRDLRPQVLITFGPDGIYGHYDHIAAHRWATIATRLAADPDCFPDLDLCEPHQISKLYYRAMTEDQVAAMAQGDQPAAVMMDGVPFTFVGRPSHEITSVIDLSDYIEAKLEGIRCHTTEVGRENRFTPEQDDATDTSWLRLEAFILAHSTVGYPTTTETDLLVGIR